MTHRYRGHRANSFLPLDINELVELRARQRTFHGAYSRTALGNLGYALTILRLFDRRFYQIGILFAILAALLFVLSYLRSRHSRHDFADPPIPSRRSIASIQDKVFDISQKNNYAEDEDVDGDSNDNCITVQGTPQNVDLSRSQSSIKIKESKGRAKGERKRSSYDNPIKTVGKENDRIFGRPFITAGWIVVGVSGVVAAVEISLLVMILQL